MMCIILPSLFLLQCTRLLCGYYRNGTGLHTQQNYRADTGKFRLYLRPNKIFQEVLQMINILLYYSSRNDKSNILFHNFESELDIQDVQKNCIHYCILNFSASKGSRNSIFYVFQQPFPCKF